MNELTAGRVQARSRNPLELWAALLVSVVCAVLLGRVLLAPHSSVSVASGTKSPSKALIAAPAAAHGSPYRASAHAAQADRFYAAQWGVTSLHVHATASGNLIRFSYRIVDARLAAPLGDDRATPTLLGERSHALLQVPVMDKIGALRQHGKQAAGKDYWMVFSNKGNLVKAGERVDVTIGNFHADGLVLE
jgi:hypothetical protein